jgi:hypothetical protein
MGKLKILRMSVLILSIGFFMAPMISMDIFTQITNVDQQHFSIQNASLYIEGTGFGSSQGTRIAYLGPYVLLIVEWSDTWINALVPGGVPYGKHYNVYIKEGTSTISNTYDFLLLIWPREVVPKVGYPGMNIKILGYQFGSTQGSKVLKIGSYNITHITSWDNSTIEAIVPSVPIGIYNIYIEDGGEVVSREESFVVVELHDIMGSWPSGVWYRNSETGLWVKITTPANSLAAGDIDADGIDDVIGVWNSGLWIKYSSSGSWAKLTSSLPDDIASGDMNGDGRDDVVATWGSSGVWYRDSISGSWIKLTNAAEIVAAGDYDYDGNDDLIGVWNSGLWVKFSSLGTWSRLSSNIPTDIASGDMNGDWDDEVLGTWPSGVYYKNLGSSSWKRMSLSPANILAAGGMDVDRKFDLIGAWSNGLWVKYSSTYSWEKLSSSLPSDLDTGIFRGGAWDVGAVGYHEPIGGYAERPGSGGFIDLSDEDPGSWNFVHREEENPVPREKDALINRTPAPEESGFTYIEQKNLMLREKKPKR